MLTQGFQCSFEKGKEKARAEQSGISTYIEPQDVGVEKDLQAADW
jgi:hypothetical protein